MASISEHLRAAVVQLAKYDTAQLDAEVLLADLLQKNRAYLYTWPEKLLNTAQKTDFWARVERRVQGEPIAHILGQKEFWSLPLYVNDSTLIPRPDTEILVEKTLALMPIEAPCHLLDLGTGTGAVALALASECPQWQILALDKAFGAVQLAQKNQHKLALTNVSIQQSDWFSRLAHDDISHQFDAIVANPPYIDAQDPLLQQGDVRFEPRGALIAEQQGLADLAYIIAQAPDYLKAGAYLLLEHGYQQADAVVALLEQRGFNGCFTEYDLAGHPRVSGGQW